MIDRAPRTERVLVANRSEIALRIIRACRELGLSPVAIYGEGEEQSAHVLAADDAYRIPDGAMLPYLNIPAIIEIANRAGATMVHPGYGFLAENAAFAEAVREAGLLFAGPTPEAMRALGDKVAARKVAVRADVPIVPGTDDPVDTVEEARAWTGQFGYPVAVKAAGGGGGRGFRVAREAGELDDAYLGSAGEAQRYFANPTVFLERYLERPRHIEVQIIADQQGNVVALGERDCSVQRRHQKLIEETPSPAVTPEIREQLMAASVSLAREVGYTSAGTVEFMLAPDGQFYFLEMNTRNSGRAHHHRNGDGIRPGQGAAPDRAGSSAFVFAVRCRSKRAFDSMPNQRRGCWTRFRTDSRDDYGLSRAGRIRHPR